MVEIKVKKGAIAFAGTFLISWFGLAALAGMLAGLMKALGRVPPNTTLIPFNIALVVALIAGFYFAFIEKNKKETGRPNNYLA